MAIICAKCGTANAEDARFCNACGASTAGSRQPPCCWCGTGNPAGSSFCAQCGKKPSELPAGMPMNLAADWQAFLRSQKLLTKEPFKDKSSLWRKTAEDAGFPWPSTEAEPWIAYPTLFAKRPIMIQSLELLDQTTGAVLETKAKVDLWATRCRVAIVDQNIGHESALGKGHILVHLAHKYTELLRVQSDGADLLLTPSTGPAARITFVGPKQRSWLLPTWLVSLVVTFQDEPVNAKALADMDVATRQSQSEQSEALPKFVEALARSMDMISG